MRLTTFGIFAVSLFLMLTPAEARAQEPGCRDVSGAIAGNVTGPGTVVGVVMGDLEGATMATITDQKEQADGTVEVKLNHVFVTEARDSLQTDDTAVWNPIPGKSGVFHMITRYKITGGTGKFKKATGTLQNHGEADTNRGLVTLGYTGRICGVAR